MLFTRPPLLRSSDIIALSATDVEALKQRLDALVTSTSSSSVLMPSDIVALSTADAEVPKQRLNALVATAEAAEEKAIVASWLPVSSLIRSRPPPPISNGRPPPRSWSPDPCLPRPRRP
jgi:hypothetical protein